MRMLLAVALLGTFLVATPTTQSGSASRVSDSLMRAFAAGGQITMDLSAGEYRISGSSDSSIRLTWSVRDAEQLRDVRTRVDARGNEATISTDGPDGDRGGFEVTIAVPSRSDLNVRLTAGEMEIDGIVGNKDVSLHAGELTINVGQPADYRRVEASVWAGEVQAGPFGRTMGGLFRSFEWNGKGTYRLEAHLKAGEIRLRDGGRRE